MQIVEISLKCGRIITFNYNFYEEILNFLKLVVPCADLLSTKFVTELLNRKFSG